MGKSIPQKYVGHYYEEVIMLVTQPDMDAGAVLAGYISGGVRFIALNLRRLFKGMPTRPDALLEPPGVT